MLQPKVSVIVPVYNVEKYLEKCISSLRNQTLEEIEIILVDDSSTDSSLEICHRAANEDSRIKVIHKANEGAGEARNAGLKIATGKYIGFVDSDDFVSEEMYQTLYTKAEKYGSDLVMSGVMHVDGSIFSKTGECVCKSYFDQDTHFETEESLKLLRLGIIGALPEDKEDSKYGMGTVKNLFKNEIIKSNNIAYQSERHIFSEDAMFMIEYISCITKATGIPEVFYHYCRHGNSVSKAYKEDRFEKCISFINEVEDLFKKDISADVYRLYIYRFWQAICRVICSQEIMYATENNVKYKNLKQRLKAVCTHQITVDALNGYPIHKLPLKQSVFAYAMKYKMYLFMKVLVRLRSR